MLSPSYVLAVLFIAIVTIYLGSKVYGEDNCYDIIISKKTAKFSFWLSLIFLVIIIGYTFYDYYVKTGTYDVSTENKIYHEVSCANNTGDKLKILNENENIVYKSRKLQELRATLVTSLNNYITPPLNKKVI